MNKTISKKNKPDKCSFPNNTDDLPKKCILSEGVPEKSQPKNGLVNGLTLETGSAKKSGRKNRRNKHTLPNSHPNINGDHHPEDNCKVPENQLDVDDHKTDISQDQSSTSVAERIPLSNGIPVENLEVSKTSKKKKNKVNLDSNDNISSTICDNKLSLGELTEPTTNDLCNKDIKPSINHNSEAVQPSSSTVILGIESSLENIQLCDSSNPPVEDSAKSKPKPKIDFVQYESEVQMPMIMKIIQKDLSEPYSIYTYRYFIHNWPKLCFLAMHESECVGAIVCKLDIHRKVVRRGYIAMLAVDEKYRNCGIGSNLVQLAITEMITGDADEVVLETEVTNKPALMLYEKLGFVRDKRLFRYYLNGVDALRLKLWLR
ncbi:unnamed protein product [Acanthoscelides obtectus]|uniref:N-terminal methionine N(alpha)-acetyltransferase NatC n=2 Tax=Acanthoscelides obtectus TaxID=200917 RepID=A0A9P0LR60_ACAOB|nr:unnamed protein product [Acanthoscelides obtectus]CAK1671861.1 N-alpha-acetyltransferase 30 [Acanthoscelides obtectus]